MAGNFFDQFDNSPVSVPIGSAPPDYQYKGPKAAADVQGAQLGNVHTLGEIAQQPAQNRLINAQADKAQVDARSAPALMAATLAQRAQALADARAKDEATKQSRQSALAARQEQLGKTQNILKLIGEAQGYVDDGWATGGLGNVMRHLPLISTEAKRLSTDVEAINQANAIYGLSQAKAGPDAVAPRITNRSEFNAYGNLALDPTTLDAPTMTNHLGLIKQVWQKRLNALTGQKPQVGARPAKPAVPKGTLTKAADGVYDWHPQ